MTDATALLQSWVMFEFMSCYEVVRGCVGMFPRVAVSFACMRLKFCIRVRVPPGTVRTLYI